MILKVKCLDSVLLASFRNVLYTVMSGLSISYKVYQPCDKLHTRILKQCDLVIRNNYSDIIITIVLTCDVSGKCVPEFFLQRVCHLVVAA